MTVGKWILNLENRSGGTAIKYKQKGTWHSINWDDYFKKIITTAQQIHEWGFKEGTHVGILSSTRWEWAIIDLALLGAQNVSVPFYSSLSDDDLLFIINHSDIKLLIIEDERYTKQLDRIKAKFTNEVVIKKLEDIDFEREPSKDYKREFLIHCADITPKDVATIVYTSGTTGTPKGVVLIHESIVSEVEEIFRIEGVKPSYTSLTFLPFAHVMGRAELWGNCYNGHTMAFAESIEKLKANLPEIKPDFMIAVPRVFEKVYAGILAQIETQPIKQKLFQTAISVAREVARYRETKQTIPWNLLLQHETICRAAFGPIKKAFGGNLKFAVSGGAPLAAELTEFFNYCGIQVLEGYGLTETCAAVAVNTPYHFQPGTVGRPMADVEVKFAADGEILLKSKKCMKEYYKNPQATADVFHDGYFATGDIGVLTPAGYLKITDRKKDLIKTAGGKYVAPQKLEGLLKQDSLISQVLIHGDQRKFVCALISIEEAQVKAWADAQGLPYEDVSDIYQNPALRLRVQKQIQTVNAQLAAHEAIKKFEIIAEAWTIENGGLTPSMKIKRKHLEKKYSHVIEEMYEG